MPINGNQQSWQSQAINTAIENHTIVNQLLTVVVAELKASLRHRKDLKTNRPLMTTMMRQHVQKRINQVLTKWGHILTPNQEDQWSHVVAIMDHFDNYTDIEIIVKSCLDDYDDHQNHLDEITLNNYLQPQSDPSSLPKVIKITYEMATHAENEYIDVATSDADSQ